MRYLIDSDWVADYLKGRPPAVSLLASLLPQGLAISIITFAEVYEGVYYGHDRPRYDRIFRQFLRGTDVLGINRRVARRFAVVRGDRRAHGLTVAEPDLFIATTALEHDLTMVTRNIRDFQRVPGLRLYGP